MPKTRGKEYDLCLVGNCIVDINYVVDAYPLLGTSNTYHRRRQRVGGIGNILDWWRDRSSLFLETSLGDDADGRLVRTAFDQAGVDHRVWPSDAPTSSAVILSSLRESQRTSFVRWGACKDLSKAAGASSRWTHVSYLDVIDGLDLKALRRRTGVLSADLCLSNPSDAVVKKVNEAAKHLDILFLSAAEDQAYRGMSNAPKITVKHNVTTTKIVTRKNSFWVQAPHNIIQSANVLGAGDVYCASFIQSLLDLTRKWKDADIKKAALVAHDTAYEFIRGNA